MRRPANPTGRSRARRSGRSLQHCAVPATSMPSQAQPFAAAGHFPDRGGDRYKFPGLDSLNACDLASAAMVSAKPLSKQDRGARPFQALQPARPVRSMASAGMANPKTWQLQSQASAALVSAQAISKPRAEQPPRKRTRNKATAVVVSHRQATTARSAKRQRFR